MVNNMIILTLKYDLRASALHLCSFYFMPLLLVTIALFISNSFFLIDFIEPVQNFKDFNQIPSSCPDYSLVIVSRTVNYAMHVSV